MKLRGTKRVRFNAVLDHADSQRIKRQAKLRGLSLSDTLRAGIKLLEEDYLTKRAAIIYAASQKAPEHHENGDGQ